MKRKLQQKRTADEKSKWLQPGMMAMAWTDKDGKRRVVVKKNKLYNSPMRPPEEYEEHVRSWRQRLEQRKREEQNGDD
jgi:hypothetical protein